MNPQVQAALIAVLGVIFGAILQATLPGSSFATRLAGKPQGHRLNGLWTSSWGEIGSQNLTHKSTLTITRHSGTTVTGHVSDSQFPARKLAIEGRYENDVLLMHYFPAPDAEDKDFIDYGCYFLRRQADGSFRGYSVGFPLTDSSLDACLDVHELRRI